MSTFIWPAEDGWPYPDEERGAVDLEAELDDDAIALRCLAAHALDGLDTLERSVVAARFGIGGAPLRTMKQLHAETGTSRAELRAALSSGLAKIRLQVS